MYHDVTVPACWLHAPRSGCARARVRCVTLTWYVVVVIMWFVLCVQLSAGLD